MITSKAFTVICLIATLAIAQAVRVSGTVVNNLNVGIQGATVTLALSKMSAITKSDGSFTIGTFTEVSNPVADNRNLTIPDNATISISVCDISGRQIYSIKTIYSPGMNILQMPVHYDGILLYKVTVSNKTYLFKFSSLNTFKMNYMVNSNTFSNQVKTAYANPWDLISVTKAGQLDYGDTLFNIDTSGIIIHMIPNAGNVVDSAGNVYQSVQIGTQVWTTSNLIQRTKFGKIPIRYIMGDAVAYENITLDTSPICCVPLQRYDVPYDLKKTGVLYNWWAVNTGELAPTGWHVATQNDWNILSSYVDKQYNLKGFTAKSLAAKTGWYPDTCYMSVGNNQHTNNITGFSAFPGAQWNNLKKDANKYVHWWGFSKSPSLAIDANMLYCNSVLFIDPSSQHGFRAIRLVKN